MPFFKQIEVNQLCTIYLWKIDEEVDQLLELVCLTENDQLKFDSYKSSSRRKEFLATRILAQKILGSSIEIENDEHGKPHLLSSDYQISITHTKGYAGIMIFKDQEAALDMEYLSDRVYKITKRFLSKSELFNIDSENKVFHLYQHWCAKECLIKLYGKKDVHLINELKIHPFLPSSNEFTGEVCRADFASTYHFQYFHFDGYLLVYATK